MSTGCDKNRSYFALIELSVIKLKDRKRYRVCRSMMFEIQSFDFLIIKSPRP